MCLHNSAAPARALVVASPKEKSTSYAKGYRLIEMWQLKRAIFQQQNNMQHLNFRRISTGEVLPEVRRSRTPFLKFSLWMGVAPALINYFILPYLLIQST